jgi:hypothetical protein
LHQAQHGSFPCFFFQTRAAARRALREAETKWLLADPIPPREARRVIGPLGQHGRSPPSVTPLIEQREALVLAATIILERFLMRESGRGV